MQKLLSIILNFLIDAERNTRKALVKRRMMGYELCRSRTLVSIMIESEDIETCSCCNRTGSRMYQYHRNETHDHHPICGRCHTIYVMIISDNRKQVVKYAEDILKEVSNA